MFDWVILTLRVVLPVITIACMTWSLIILNGVVTKEPENMKLPVEAYWVSMTVSAVLPIASALAGSFVCFLIGQVVVTIDLESLLLVQKEKRHVLLSK